MASTYPERAPLAEAGFDITLRHMDSAPLLEVGAWDRFFQTTASARPPLANLPDPTWTVDSGCRNVAERSGPAYKAQAPKPARRSQD